MLELMLIRDCTLRIVTNSHLHFAGHKSLHGREIVVYLNTNESVTHLPTPATWLLSHEQRMQVRYGAKRLLTRLEKCSPSLCRKIYGRNMDGVCALSPITNCVLFSAVYLEMRISVPFLTWKPGTFINQNHPDNCVGYCSRYLNETNFQLFFINLLHF